MIRKTTIISVKMNRKTLSFSLNIERLIGTILTPVSARLDNVTSPSCCGFMTVDRGEAETEREREAKPQVVSITQLSAAELYKKRGIFLTKSNG